MMPTHEIFMQRCLDLAANGLGQVAPNPMVGAVIVHNSLIIGEGFHTGFGKPHAEVEAVNQIKDQAFLKESTLYVNLEPCSHFGKTPPCTKLILEMGIPRVVIGQADPHATAGGGAKILKDNGVEVITDVLGDESRWLNRRFNIFHRLKRPWLILKWAQTTDGFVDADRGEDGGRPSWITDETCRRLVHKWRAEEQALMVGSSTVLADNPQLNVRAWDGNDPLRLTIDRPGRLIETENQTDRKGLPLHILDGTIPTVIYTDKAQTGRPKLDFVELTHPEDVWSDIMQDLYTRNIQSVIIEGGPTLLKTLITAGLWDEARVFVGPAWFGKGVPAPKFPFQPDSVDEVGNSRLLSFVKEDGRTQFMRCGVG